MVFPLLPDASAGRRKAVPPAFACSWTTGGLECACVHVAGELDMATTPRLTRTLCEAWLRARLVVLDLRDVAFMDSSGVHAIVGASLRARRLGRRLVVLRGPPAVDQMFTLTQSFDGVDIHDLDPAEPPVQVLQKLAGEELLR